MSKNTFSISANGFQYKDCWENIDIGLSMNNVCNELTVSTLNFFESKLKLFKSSDDWKLKKGSKFFATVNDEIIMTGYIDDVNVSYSGEGSNIGFYMRDKTSDIVDCPYFSEDKNEWKNQKLKDIIIDLCNPFGINVDIDYSANSALSIILKDYTVDQGRSVADIIVDECVKVGVLVTADGRGNLYLTKPTLTDISSDIISDTNILSCDMSSSLKERYSNYLTKAEIALDKIYNQTDEQLWIEREGKGSYKSKIVDRELGNRYRPLILLSDTAQTIDDCLKRSTYEATIRMAKSLRINYTLEGWTEVNSGRIWKPNRLVQVNDKKIEVDELMLINSVNLNYDGSKFTTTLELVRKECYSTNEQALQLIRKGF